MCDITFDCCRALRPRRPGHAGGAGTCQPSGLVVFAGLSHATFTVQERAPVIDMHMHAHHIPLDIPAGAPPPCLPSPCRPEGAATATPKESMRKTLEAIDRHNIVLGVLSSAELDIVRGS